MTNPLFFTFFSSAHHHNTFFVKKCQHSTTKSGNFLQKPRNVETFLCKFTKFQKNFSTILTKTQYVVIINYSYTTVRGIRSRTDAGDDNAIGAFSTVGHRFVFPDKETVCTAFAVRKKADFDSISKGVLMNSFKNIITMERSRTYNYGEDIPPEVHEPCPVCGSVSWDYLLRDKDGFFAGCDDCLKKIYC